MFKAANVYLNLRPESTNSHQNLQSIEQERDVRIPVRVYDEANQFVRKLMTIGVNSV